MRNSILALAAAAATLTGVAYAQQPPAQQTPAPPPPGDPLGAATISRADAQARASAMFDRFDVNHDGKLDQADRAARVTAMFDQIDGNHDGVISRDEFGAAHERMGGPMGRHMGSKGQGRGPGGGDHAKMGHGGMNHGDMGPGAMPPPQPGADPRAPLARDAFMAEAMKRFDAADSNHDGKVTAQERRMAMRGRHGRMGRGGQPGPDMPPPPPGMGS